MIKYIVLLLLVLQVSAYELTGDNLIQPRYYEGNLLIINDGSVSYSIYSNDTYLGTILPNQGMYINESHDYKIYSSYLKIDDITPEKIEENININWFTYLLIIIGIIVSIKIITVVIKK